jgi:hypothetical protein
MATRRDAPLVEFEATVQRTKDRLIAISASVQRKLGLSKRRDVHLVDFSIRPKGRGRWNHHVTYLTRKSTFAIPTDVTHIRGGQRVVIKIHRILENRDAVLGEPTAADVLLQFAGMIDDGRTDGSVNVDHYLYGSSPKKSR